MAAPAMKMLASHALAQLLGGVAGADVADLMAEQGGQFGLVVQFHQHAPGDRDRTAGKGIGVDVGGVDPAEGEGHLRPVGPGGQFPADPVDIAVEGGILDHPVIRGKLIGRPLPVDVDFLAFRHHHQLLTAGDRINGTAAQQMARNQGAGSDAQQLSSSRRFREKDSTGLFFISFSLRNLVDEFPPDRLNEWPQRFEEPTERGGGCSARPSGGTADAAAGIP
jgi:hypothetical protein